MKLAMYLLLVLQTLWETDLREINIGQTATKYSGNYTFNANEIYLLPSYYFDRAIPCKNIHRPPLLNV